MSTNVLVTEMYRCRTCGDDPRGKRHGWVRCGSCGEPVCSVHGIPPKCAPCRYEDDLAAERRRLERGY